MSEKKGKGDCTALNLRAVAKRVTQGRWIAVNVFIIKEGRWKTKTVIKSLF